MLHMIEMLALYQYFQAVNQWLATNVSEHHHQYQDGSPNLESYFSGSDQGGCCTANNGQGETTMTLSTSVTSFCTATVV